MFCYQEPIFKTLQIFNERLYSCYFLDVRFIFSHFKHRILPFWSTEHGNVNK